MPKKKIYKFSGLAPSKDTTTQDQRDEFSIRLQQFFQYPAGTTAQDWSVLFFLLAEKVKSGRVIIFLDEISWMAMEDTTFLGKLKTAWDDYFSKNPKLILIVCGSVSSWIKDNLIESTGFVGRINIDMTLDEIPKATMKHVH